MAKTPDTVWPQFPDSWPVYRNGSSDVIADEQAERFGFDSGNAGWPALRWLRRLLWTVALVLAAADVTLLLLLRR